MESILSINSILSDLRLHEATIDTSELISKVYEIFEKDKGAPGIIVIQDDQFYGILSRNRFFEVMSKQFMFDLFSKRKVDFFFDSAEIKKYLILPASTSIISATNSAFQRHKSEMYEPIVVHFGNNEFKILDFYQLILSQNIIQQMMNNLLQQANEFKQEVLAITAHDLRNPIGAILGFSDIIMKAEDITETKEFAGYVNKVAGQMEDLVNDFLVSAVNNSTDFEIVNTWFNFLELISFTVSNFEFAANHKFQTILFDHSPSDFMIFSDKNRLKEVAENLISNAIKYSDVGKEIRIKLTTTDDCIALTVKDQGPGFSDEDMAKLYGKFQRLSAKPTGNESSTGLGLFITKKIINMLKGKISLESKLGQGSTFTIYIPVKG